MKYKSPARVLALDLHPRRFGYVVLERPDTLLDWGVRSNRGKGNHYDVFVRRRLGLLLELWRPSVLVIRKPARMLRRRSGVDFLIPRIVAVAKSRRISVRILKHGFGDGQKRKMTKYENARRVVERFTVLAQKLPPKRKTWESEDYRMCMFTAAALAMAQLNIANSFPAPSSPQSSL